MSGVYMVKVCMKYEQIVRVEADSKEAAHEQALDDAFSMAPSGAVHFAGCPYVTAVREPSGDEL